jgi:hypothetical protein
MTQPLFRKSTFREERTRPNGRTAKIKFSREEDRALLHLVQEIGDTDWAKVSQRLGSRSPRQCRERYKNYLDPSLRHGEWSTTEDLLLLIKYQEYGAKWNLMTHFFKNRSENALRNRWNLLDRRRMKEMIPGTISWAPLVISKPATPPLPADEIVIEKPAPLQEPVSLPPRTQSELTGLFDVSRQLPQGSCLHDDPFNLWSSLEFSHH